MKWMRFSCYPALPVQATSARGRRLRGLRAESGEGAPEIWVRIKGLRSASLGPWALPELPPPALQPRAIPGELHKPAGRRGGAGVGGCRTHPAAAPATPQLKRIWWGGPAKERARNAGQSAGRTDPRTDAPAHADA